MLNGELSHMQDDAIDWMTTWVSEPTGSMGRRTKGIFIFLLPVFYRSTFASLGVNFAHFWFACQPLAAAGSQIPFPVEWHFIWVWRLWEEPETPGKWLGSLDSRTTRPCMKSFGWSGEFSRANGWESSRQLRLRRDYNIIYKIGQFVELPLVPTS